MAAHQGGPKRGRATASTLALTPLEPAFSRRMTATSLRLWFLRCSVLGLLWAGMSCVPRLAAATGFAPDAEQIDRLVAVLDRRLALMPEVAAIKFQQQTPIADPARELQVLEQSVADAISLHLEPAAARTFVAVQIAMARSVQEELHARWRAGTASPPRARDLGGELRPALDALGRELWPAVYLASHALTATSPVALASHLAPLLRHPGTTEAQRDELAAALATLRITKAPNLALIRRLGTMRVGTTADYAPYSAEHEGALEGLDIELARALAAAWGVKVIFVRTSWPTLMADLAARRFDLAASGISITAERERVAAFSVPYLFDGKTPIARRANAARFATLEGIDQPDVRVIVNPGGTNERFARDHLTRATIRVHPDNRTIFDEIAAGRADVMITDGIEVRLQSRRWTELQGSRQEPFTRAGKAFLLPAGSDFAAQLDPWLAARIERGEVAAALERALTASALR